MLGPPWAHGKLGLVPAGSHLPGHHCYMSLATFRSACTIRPRRLPASLEIGLCTCR